jgi:hypothetical protein
LAVGHPEQLSGSSDLKCRHARRLVFRHLYALLDCVLPMLSEDVVQDLLDEITPAIGTDVCVSPERLSDHARERVTLFEGHGAHPHFCKVR